MESHKCPRCFDVAKLRYRDFSDQALAALVTWGEMEAKTVGQPFCNSCYEDMRETLIDRVDELHAPAKAKKGKTRAPRRKKSPEAGDAT